MYIVYQTPLPFKAKVQSSLPNQDFMEIDAMVMVYEYAMGAVVGKTGKTAVLPEI